VDFAIALAFLAVAVLGFGWVEDIAARRKPRMSPFPRKKRQRPEPVVAVPAVATR
jgi:hypothetical protein